MQKKFLSQTLSIVFALLALATQGCMYAQTMVDGSSPDVPNQELMGFNLDSIQGVAHSWIATVRLIDFPELLENRPPDRVGVRMTFIDRFLPGTTPDQCLGMNTTFGGYFLVQWDDEGKVELPIYGRPIFEPDWWTETRAVSVKFSASWRLGNGSFVRSPWTAPICLLVPDDDNGNPWDDGSGKGGPLGAEIMGAELF